MRVKEVTQKLRCYEFHLDTFFFAKMYFVFNKLYKFRYKFRSEQS